MFVKVRFALIYCGRTMAERADQCKTTLPIWIQTTEEPMILKLRREYAAVKVDIVASEAEAALSSGAQDVPCDA